MGYKRFLGDQDLKRKLFTQVELSIMPHHGIPPHLVIAHGADQIGQKWAKNGPKMVQKWAKNEK